MLVSVPSELEIPAPVDQARSLGSRGFAALPCIGEGAPFHLTLAVLAIGVATSRVVEEGSGGFGYRWDSGSRGGVLNDLMPTLHANPKWCRE